MRLPLSYLCAGVILVTSCLVGCAPDDPADVNEATQPSAEQSLTYRSPGAERVAADAESVDSLRRQIDNLSARIDLLLEERGRQQAPVRADSTAEEALRATAEGMQWFGLRLLVAVVLMLLTFLVVKFGVSILDYFAERSASRRLFLKRLIPVLRVFVWAVAVYFIVAVVFEVDRGGMLAAAAAIGVAVGFAAQDVLKNIFGGIILIFDQPFQVGDKVSIAGTYGEVVSIGLRSTRIVTPDDNLVTVPNSQAADSQVANANAGALTCQVVVDLYLPGWMDIQKAKTIAYQAAVNSRYVYLEKPIKVVVRDEFKTTFLTHLKVKAYVVDARYENDLASDITEAAKAEFIREGMLVPLTGIAAMPSDPDVG